MSSIRILSPHPSRLRRATFPLGGRLRGERRNEVSHKILLPTFLFKKSRSVEAVHGPVGALFQDALHGVGGPLHRLVHDLFVLPLELAQHPVGQVVVGVRLLTHAHPDYDLADWVLGKFQGEDKKIMEQAVERAADAVECLLREGIDRAMNRFNG